MRFARTASVSVIFAVAGSAALAGVGAPVAAAKQGATVSVSPASGPAGSGFTISFSNFSRACGQIEFLWDDQRLASLPWQSRGSVQVTVPVNAKVGAHIVTGRACQNVARDIFLVLPGSAPPGTTDPGPIVTAPTGPPTTTARQPTTTRRTTTTTTTTTGSTTTTTSSTTTSAAPGRLTFDKPSVQVGEPLSATGTGCTANAPVKLTANGEQVGSATTDAGGAFTTPVEFTKIRPGRQLVTASCGGVVLAGSVDLHLATSASGSTGILVVIFLVLLAAVTLIAHHRTKAKA